VKLKEKNASLLVPHTSRTTAGNWGIVDFGFTILNFGFTPRVAGP
jgi:hypothetical protein